MMNQDFLFVSRYDEQAEMANHGRQGNGREFVVKIKRTRTKSNQNKKFIFLKDNRNSLKKSKRSKAKTEEEWKEQKKIFTCLQ
jgi:hypothetical protein